MKALEDTVIPTAGQLMGDKPLHLDIPQQWILAQWAVKTAMVFEFSKAESADPFYQKNDRYALRLSHAIPPFTVLALGRTDATASDMSFLSQSRQGVFSDPRGLSAKLFRATLVFEHLVIQITSIRPDQPVARIRFHPKARWADATIRIWPTIAPVFWPPTEIIPSDGFFDGFHNDPPEITIDPL